MRAGDVDVKADADRTTQARATLERKQPAPKRSGAAGLIAKAQNPLPAGAQLPAGSMTILVATTITEGEMRWSMHNGRGPLLRKLQDAGVGQISILNRKSVVR